MNVVSLTIGSFVIKLPCPIVVVDFTLAAILWWWFVGFLCDGCFLCSGLGEKAVVMTGME